MSRKKIAIIGGGSAGLMAAVHLSEEYDVAIYEKGKTVGRKFLVAGKGGFNLTNQATGQDLVKQFLPNGFLANVLLKNDSVQMRNWLSDLGIPTFVGSSGRVFPRKGIKPIQVLKKIKERLEQNRVSIFFHHEFVGFNKKCKVIVRSKIQEHKIEADFYVFALGGASWSVTGSDGKWSAAFEKLGIKILPFESSNCGLNIKWSPQIKENHLGKPLKNIEVTINDFKVKGEAVVTDYGLEGNAIYPLAHQVRHSFYNLSERQTGNTIPKIYVDFKPFNSKEELLEKLKNKPPKSKSYAKALNLNAIQMALIKSFSGKEKFFEPLVFIDRVKHLQIPIQSLRPMEEAISTVGGIALEEVNPNFSLKKYPNIFVIGEMLDWDAPTGGFLLQACYSMARSLKL